MCVLTRPVRVHGAPVLQKRVALLNYISLDCVFLCGVSRVFFSQQWHTSGVPALGKVKAGKARVPGLKETL